MRKLTVLLVALGLCALPAVALGAFRTGTWKVTGKVSHVTTEKDRTVRFTAFVARGTCKVADGVDANGQPKSRKVKGTCLSFRGKSSYESICTLSNGRTIPQSVVPPSGYLVSKTGTYAVTEKTDSENVGAKSRSTHTVSITMRGSNGSGNVRYRSSDASVGGVVNCVGDVKITMKR